jgi:hypothetical protein
MVKHAHNPLFSPVQIGAINLDAKGRRAGE